MTAKKKQGAAAKIKKPDEDMLDQKSIASLKNKVRGIIYHEAKNFHSKHAGHRVREIVIHAELLPFRFATRSAEVLDDGAPWRHDGGDVRFQISQTHDELELYTPEGEFVKSYAVSSDGQVRIPDLDKGVYILYLRGRKISSLSPASD